MDAVQLVAQAQKGDGVAFAELLGPYQSQLYRIAFSYVKNREDALDVVSETVYRAFVNLRNLKQASHFNTWLVRIAINQAINLRRQRQRVVVTGDVDAVPISGVGVDADEWIDLAAAVEKLDDDQRAVIILKYYEDLTLAEVAEILERPLGTIKTLLHKALRILRLELKEVF